VTANGQRQDAQLSMPQGLLHAIVSPTQTPAKFEVDTAVGTAAVRSTDWLIEATANDQQVSVVSGSVVVMSAATHHGVVVPAHETTRLARGHDPLPPRPLSRAAFQRILGRTEMRRGSHIERQRAHPGDHRGRISPVRRDGHRPGEPTTEKRRLAPAPRNNERRPEQERTR
jgi:hypothetical protein